MTIFPSRPAIGWAGIESGDTLSTAAKHSNEWTSVSGKNRCWTAAQYKGTAEEAYRLQFGSQKVEFVCSGWDAGQMKKALRPEPEGLSASPSERRFA
jgi:hypothetical protein